MERICACCKKEIQNAEEIHFCPYCATPVSQTDTVSAQNNVAWKNETTWGNQAVYADKIKRICRDLVARINSWVSEQASYFAEQKSAQFVTKQQMCDDFVYLHSAPNTEELEHEYRSFMRLLRAICSGEKMLRSERAVHVDADTHIQENLHLFEAIVGVFSETNRTQEETTASALMSKNATVDFEEVLSALDRAFESVRIIIQSQGYLCVQNCNFDPDTVRLLSKYSFVDSHGTLCYDLHRVVAALNNSCENDFSDLFDHKYEEHLIMFFEGLWIVFQCILTRFLPNTQSEGVSNCCDYAEEWLSHMEVAIDRAKCYPDTDMVEMYLVAKKACGIVKKNFE